MFWLCLIEWSFSIFKLSNSSLTTLKGSKSRLSVLLCLLSLLCCCCFPPRPLRSRGGKDGGMPGWLAERPYDGTGRMGYRSRPIKPLSPKRSVEVSRLNRKMQKKMNFGSIWRNSDSVTARLYYLKEFQKFFTE